jgi:hypothetical protein
MLYSTAEGTRRRQLVVGGIAIVLLLASFLTYTVLAHRSATTPAIAPRAMQPSSEAEQPIAEASPNQLSPLPSTADPEAFARLAAEALFEWNTGTVITRTKHIERLVKVADPTGESTAGLVSDIENYLPTPEAWAQLQQYETRQWLEVESTRTPSSWSKAETQVGPAGLLPGTTAYNISGVRHRAGVWEGAPVSSAHHVAFTMFVVCGPTYPQCYLLRLSLLDEPLD